LSKDLVSNLTLISIRSEISLIFCGSSISRWN